VNRRGVSGLYSKVERPMFLNIILIAAGFIALVLIMAFVLNPPEAWVKKFFKRKW
jgi:hypothetical protein